MYVEYVTGLCYSYEKYDVLILSQSVLYGVWTAMKRIREEPLLSSSFILRIGR